MYHKLLYSYAGVSTELLIYDPASVMILIDVGDGIIRDLLKEGISFPLEVPLHIFITHGHFDHCGGLFSLLGFLRMLGEENSVSVYYPTDSIEINGILKAFRSSYSDTLPFKLKTISLVHNEEIILNSRLVMKTYGTKHFGSTLSHGILGRIPSLGYALFRDNKKWLAFTGDSGMNEQLIKLIENSEHAYIEATNQKKKTVHHLNIEEATILGKLAHNYTLIHTRYESR